jgi:hypothetical protein
MALYVNRASRHCLARAVYSAAKVLLLAEMVISAHQNLAVAETGPKAEEKIRFALLDLEEKPHQIHPVKEVKVWAFIFLSTECPIARSYLAPLNELANQWKKEQPGLRFYGVISDPTVTRTDAAKFVEEFAVTFPVLFDASGQMADVLLPTHVPEAFVFDGDLQLAYRGRIDDTYAQIGKRRPEPTEHNLRDAVASLLSGNKPKIAVTKPIGCPFESLADRSGKETVTYTRDIAPVMRIRCTSCHQKKGTSFGLESYRTVKDRAKGLMSLSSNTNSSSIEEHEEVFGKNGLTPFERALIKRWIDTEMIEGDSQELSKAQR